MNARDRIAEALGNAQVEFGNNARIRHYHRHLADAMLVILPDLLTDPEVVEAAASELRRWEVEAVAGINYEATPSVTRQMLDAAAKALTGGDT